MSDANPASPAPARRSIAAPLAMGVALAVLAGVAVRRAVTDPAEPHTPLGVTPPGEPRGNVLADYFEICDFSLVDQDGRSFTRKALEGRIAVVDFFFTSCPSACIALTAKMRSLAEALRGESDVLLVSISVDPSTDTPEVLKRYAAVNGAGSTNWTFVSGAVEEVKRVCESFKAALGVKDATGDISHSTRLYVVDRHGHLRAIHDTQIDAEWKPATIHSVRLLLEQQPRGQ